MDSSSDKINLLPSQAFSELKSIIPYMNSVQAAYPGTEGRLMEIVQLVVAARQDNPALSRFLTQHERVHYANPVSHNPELALTILEQFPDVRARTTSDWIEYVYSTAFLKQTALAPHQLEQILHNTYRHREVPGMLKEFYEPETVQALLEHRYANHPGAVHAYMAELYPEPYHMPMAGSGVASNTFAMAKK